MESELVLDGVLAQDTTQAASLWSLREGITEACTKLGAAFKYDLSTAPGEMYDLVEKMRARLEERGLLKGEWEGEVGTVVGFGHMGDGEVLSFGSTAPTGVYAGHVYICIACLILMLSEPSF